MENPFSLQVGGTHYKSMKIQPVEFILANELGFCEGNIIKYTCRYKQKGGVQDLKKVIHYAELLIQSIEQEQTPEQRLKDYLDEQKIAYQGKTGPSQLDQALDIRATNDGEGTLSLRISK